MNQRGKGNPAARTPWCSNLKVRPGSLKKRNVLPSPPPVPYEGLSDGESPLPHAQQRELVWGRKHH